MSVVGFNNPSKRQAEEIEQNSPQAAQDSPQVEDMPTNYLQAQTVDKMQALGNMICSEGFASLPIEQKETLLMDFAYFTNVANAL